MEQKVNGAINAAERNPTQISFVFTPPLLTHRFSTLFAAINLFKVDSTLRFVHNYRLNSDLSVGQRYPPLEEMGLRNLSVELSLKLTSITYAFVKFFFGFPQLDLVLMGDCFFCGFTTLSLRFTITPS